jgi:Spy/CpxP family protein refolding chaperone
MNIARKFGIFALLLFVASLLQAQTPTPAPKQKGRPQAVPTEQMTDKEDTQMENDLNLTPEQKQKFKQINEEYKAKMKTAKADKKADMQQYREQRKAAHKALLTEEQARKYDEKMAAREAKRAEKTNGKGGANGKGKGKSKGKGKGYYGPDKTDKTNKSKGAEPDKDQNEKQ